MKNKLKIYQANVPFETKESNFVMQLNNCKGVCEKDFFKVVLSNGSEFSSPLEFLEKDLVSETYIGYFNNNETFRLVKPNELALNKIIKDFKCNSAFSIGNFDPDGYAFHFIITDNFNQEINIKYSDPNEMLKKLIYTSAIALDTGLHQNFLDFTKRILKRIKSIEEIEKFPRSEEIIEIMKFNINLYVVEERKKIMDF